MRQCKPVCQNDIAQKACIGPHFGVPYRYMKLGIIGKPQSGKTTLFNTAAGAQETVGDFSQAVHRAVIKVPDDRLLKLADIVNPKKITYAEIEFLDAPGFSGEGKKSSGLEIHPDIRKMDAFMLVIDAFSGEAKPEADIR